MKVDSRKYLTAHGKAPRGKGNWLFEVELIDGTVVVWGPGMNYTYKDASAWVCKEAIKYNAIYIKLCS